MIDSTLFRSGFQYGLLIGLVGNFGAMGIAFALRLLKRR